MPAPPGASTWTPLLDGAARDRAVDAAIVIAQTLSAASPLANSSDMSPTLSGVLGGALFFTAVGEATRDDTYREIAVTLLDDAIGRANDLDQPAISLYGAPVGLGWVDAVLRVRIAHDGDPHDDETDVDRFVSNVLAQDRWPWPVDLIHGLTGLGMYSLARLPRESARRSLARIVGHLATLAEEDEAGLAWRFVPGPGARSMFNEHRPEGNVNLGFAHGQPGIVAFLAAAHRAGISGAGDLLDPAVRWLTAQRLPPGDRSMFPAFVVRGRPAKGTRMAWCYGDAGVSVSLVAAGDALGDPDLVELAREVALACVGHSGENVDGATLCHGSAGLGHIFNRMGHALGDERLLALARHWFDVSLDEHLTDLSVVDRDRAKQVLAGGGALVVEPGYGFLFGAAGAGLALLAATANQEPWWDGVLFVQPPGTWPTQTYATMEA